VNLLNIQRVSYAVSRNSRRVSGFHLPEVEFHFLSENLAGSFRSTVAATYIATHDFEAG
jgi:hypothetical protein